jgi:hypothetical protein
LRLIRQRCRSWRQEACDLRQCLLEQDSRETSTLDRAASLYIEYLRRETASLIVRRNVERDTLGRIPHGRGVSQRIGVDEAR